MDGSTLTVRPDVQRGGTDIPSSFREGQPLSIDLDLATAGRTSDSRWPWRGLAVALLAHGAVLAALMWRPEPDGASGGVVLDAIEISVIDGRALEAMLAAARTDSAAPDAPVKSDNGAPATNQQEAASETSGKTAEASVTVLQATDSSVSVPVEPPKASAEFRAAEKAEAPTATAASEAASNAGGASTRGADATSPAEPAGTRAPPGVVHDYALSVAKVLARNKPEAQGPKGTARVRFTVERDGRVAEASVLASSGHTVLDAAALAAVRRSRFPAPPVVLTQADRTFDLPFHFR